MRPKNPPCIIDIEASGFGPSGYPIEVGVALSSGEQYCSLIHPSPEWTFWDDEAEKVHRVPRDILETYGKPLGEVADNLNSLLENQTVYSDGWVVDNPWVLQLFDKARVPLRFNVSALEMILTEGQMEIWHEAKEKILEEVGLKRHRASMDAIIIQKTYVSTYEA